MAEQYDPVSSLVAIMGGTEASIDLIQSGPHYMRRMREQRVGVVRAIQSLTARLLQLEIALDDD